MLNDIIQLLGLANPQLSIFWTVKGKSTPTVLPSVDSDKFTLSSDPSDEWAAPCAGILTENQHNKLLQMPDGSTPTEGIVLQMVPQVYLALSRLYATIIEGKTANTNLPDRPVPRYFLYTGFTKLNNSGDDPGPKPGFYKAGDPLRLTGKLTMHDEEGIVIEPLAVANALDIMMQTHWSMESKPIGSSTPSGSTAPPFTPQSSRQVFNISQSGNTEQKIYFTDIFNAPFAPTSFPFGNVTRVNGSLYTLTATGTPVNKNAGTDDLLQLALSANGLFGNSLNYPSKASGISLKHDYVRVKVVNWKDQLLGDIPDTEPVKSNNVLPDIRDNELIKFCFTGNECLGHINDINGSAAQEKTIISTDIQTDFSLPPLPNGNGNELWPSFADGAVPGTAAIDSSVEKTFNSTAHFITDAAANNTDVYLQINSSQLQNGWAVRVLHRVFHADGTETRGDGAGIIVKNNIAAFRIKDPLGINRPFTSGITPPANPKLLVDMIIVNGASPSVQSRRMGNIVVSINPASALSAEEQANLLTGTNALNSAVNRGISPGGFLGLKTSPNPISLITNVKAFLLASGTDPDVQPAVSPVLPTQSRLEGIAADITGTSWTSFLGGIRLIKDSRENFLRLGNPGSPGGADTHTTGLITSGGRLAYDIARMGLRRSRALSARMKQLISNTNYALPALPAAAGRTFIGALLQTIAKKTESPRLEEFQQTLTNLPASAAVLASQIQQLVSSNTKPDWLPDSIKDQFKTAMTGITVNEANSRLALEELKREYVSSIFGRRDSLFSVKTAIKNARHFIYIESSFFGPTKYPDTAGGDPPEDDLIEVIKKQLIARPGLKLILSLAQEIPFNRGYDNIARLHNNNRNNAINRLLGTQDPVTKKYERQDQVVAFHPLGFPGRPVKVNTQCIIVDDVWAMMGTSNFSQRGFNFDGSTDIVFCDKQLKNGKSTSISALRRRLMLQYLKVDNSLTAMPDSNQVFLQDGRSAFDMFRALIDGGGGAMVRGIVPVQLTDISAPELTALQNLADPNGDTFYQAQAVLNTWLTALSTVPE